MQLKDGNPIKATYHASHQSPQRSPSTETLRLRVNRLSIYLLLLTVVYLTCA
jgi:hypothetical protein